MELFDKRGKPIRHARDVRYDNFLSGLTADHVQAAIDEIIATAEETALDAVGNNLVDSDSIQFTYDDGAGFITADIDESFEPTWTGEHTFTRPSTFLDDVRIADDNVELQIGEEADLRLFHDGTDSFVRSDTGALKFFLGSSEVAALSGGVLYTGITAADAAGFPFGSTSLFVNGVGHIFRLGNFPGLVGVRANGSLGSLTAVESGNELLRHEGRGYYTSGGPSNVSGGDFSFIATQAFTSTAAGTLFRLRVVPTDSTTATEILSSRINASGVGTVRGPDGDASTPGWSFLSDPDTGLFRIGANGLGFSTGGVQRMGINDGRVYVGVTKAQEDLVPGLGVSTYTAVLSDAINIVREATVPTLQFSRFNGTYAAPQAVSNTDVIFSLVVRGYYGSAWRTAADFRALATEDFSSTGLGTRFSFRVIPQGTASALTEVLSLQAVSGTGQAQGPSGTETLPGWSFLVDPDTGMYLSGTNQLSFTTAGTQRFQISATNVYVTSGGLGIPDGITAPGTVLGYALLYVDSADGDLKVKFGDGTVKTIVTDT